MITLTLDRSYRIPTRWTDFNEFYGQQFVKLATAMHDFEHGVVDFDRFRLEVAFALIGLDKRKIGRISETLEENVFRISELVTFPWRMENTDGYDTVYMDIRLMSNLLPRLKGHLGYTFLVTDGGIVDTSITADQYIDAVQLTQVHARNGCRESLDRLSDILYGEGAGCDLTLPMKVAVYYNWRGILDWVRTIPSYALVFSNTRASAMPSSPLGMAGSIFAMAKAGYGSIDDLRGLDMFTYLGILVQMTVDSIMAMKAQKISPSDAASKLGLDTSLVTPYYTSKD